MSHFNWNHENLYFNAINATKKLWFYPFIGLAVPSPPPKSSHPKNPIYIAEGFELGLVGHKMVKTDYSRLC